MMDLSYILALFLGMSFYHLSKKSSSLDRIVLLTVISMTSASLSVIVYMLFKNYSYGISVFVYTIHFISGYLLSWVNVIIANKFSKK